jgi:carbohydrate binding protein with CBM5/12 domain
MLDDNSIALPPELIPGPITINEVDRRIKTWINNERDRTRELLVELLVRTQEEGIAGPPGPPGPPGPAGLFPVAKAWQRDTVYYAGDVVTHSGATWQAVRDTGQEPPARDWRCLAAPARSPRSRGIYDPDTSYVALDVVVCAKGAWIARKDNPGSCPGNGWRLLVRDGRAGTPGAEGQRGERGERGPKGEDGKALTIIDWRLDCTAYEATPVMSDGSYGAVLKLRGLFEQFFREVR